MKMLFIQLLLVAAPFFVLAQQLQPEWVSTEETDGDFGNDKLPIILIDSFHNIIVCGDTYGAGPGIGFITTKYNSDGVKLWQRRHDTFAQDFITTAVTDASGNVYVGGNSTNPFTNKIGFIVIKYGPAGDTLWTYGYGDANTGSRLGQLLLTPEQDILVTGDYYFTDASDAGLVAVRLSPDGVTQWEATYSEGEVGYGALGAVLTQNLVVWGVSSSKFICWQLNLDGQYLDANFSEPYLDYYLNSYHIDRHGDFYVGDYLGEYKVTKFTPDGNIAWAYNKPITGLDPNGINARTESITTDKAGEVYISGDYYIDTVVGRVALTTHLNTNGDLLWEHYFSKPDYNTSPNKISWISDDILATTGLMYHFDSSTYYQCFLFFYDQDGFINGGIISLEGSRNIGAAIAADSAAIYFSGMSFSVDFPYIDKLFVCKFDQSVVSAAKEPDAVKQTTILHVFPNPFTQEIQIMLDGVKDHSAKLNIINAMGQVVWAQDFQTLPASDGILTVTGLEALPAGIYAIMLYTAHEVFSGKAMKMNDER